MAYIGQQATSRYTTRQTVQQFNGDASTTAFTLNQTVSTDQDILVSVDGVIQDTSAYAVSNGTTLTFSPAPSSGTANIFVNFLGLTTATITPPAVNKGTFSGGSVFRTNVQSLNANATIATTENASCAGPLTVASGVTLTVASGGRLTVL
mgnify:CR=1 FL=1